MQNTHKKILLIAIFICACGASYLYGASSAAQKYMGNSNYDVQVPSGKVSTYVETESISNYDLTVKISQIVAPLGIINVRPYTVYSQSDTLVQIGYIESAKSGSDITPIMRVHFYKKASPEIFQSACDLISDAGFGATAIKINGYEACMVEGETKNIEYAVINGYYAAVFNLQLEEQWSPANLFNYAIDGNNMLPYFERVIHSIEFKN